MWQKEFGSTNSRNYEYLLAAIVVLVAIGFLFKKPILFLLVGVFTAYLLLNKIYDKKIGEKLEMANQRKVVRLFPGDETILEFELQNRSIFPIVNGEFQFQSDPAIKATNYVETTSKYWNQFTLPLSAIGKGKVTISLPIRAEQRGTARVKNIHYQFPHLLNFDSVTLKYDAYFNLEYVVFPKPIPVHGLDILTQMAPGTQQAHFSAFEDVQSIRGTRDYTNGDPFHQINWKASAKTQELQTNVYDKVVDMAYLFIVNIGTKHGLNMTQLNKDLEKVLSYAAFLCQYTTTKGYPFEVVVNARKPGKIPYVAMHEGEGKNHYAQTLELLARIHPQTMVVPFTQMLHRVGQTLYKPKTIVIIGEIPQEAAGMIEKWQGTQKHIYHIAPTDDEAVMKRWKKEAITHAAK